MLVRTTTHDRKAGAPWRRIGLALAGALLLGDAIALMLTGLFNFGVALPGAIGAACLALSWNWVAMAQWRAASAPRRWFWRAGWRGGGDSALLALQRLVAGVFCVY